MFGHPIYSEAIRPTSNFCKKLSYRKSIARKLGTQYVDGIYNNSVTLKSGLEVTQGHSVGHLVRWYQTGAI